MASKYWIKLYIEILDDPKMGLLNDRLYRRTIELFLIAGETDQEGLLPPLRELAWRLRVTEKQILQDLKKLEQVDITANEGERWMITNFAERQAPVSDAERMRQLRSRRQKEQYEGYENVTNPVTNYVTKRNVDTDTDTDNRLKELNTEGDNEKKSPQTDKEQEPKKSQEGSINAISVPKSKDEVDKYIEVFETTMGKKIIPYPGIVDLIQEFKTEGVTPQIYKNALLGLQANGYTVSNMQSAKTWAIKDAREKKNPKPIKNRRNGDGLYMENMSAKWNEKSRSQKVESLEYMRAQNRLKPEAEQEGIRLGLIKETK